MLALVRSASLNHWMYLFQSPGVVAIRNPTSLSAGAMLILPRKRNNKNEVFNRSEEKSAGKGYRSAARPARRSPPIAKYERGSDLEVLRQLQALRLIVRADAHAVER